MIFSKKNKILILGLGKSGVAAAKLATEKGYEVIALDEHRSDNLLKNQKELSGKGIKSLLGFNDNQLPDCDLIVISPGISPSSFLGKLAEESGVEIISEIEFAYRFCSAPVIAITGTNGKTTVTELCCCLLQKFGLKVITAGNIGNPLSYVVLKNEYYDYIILEISSFQLHYIDKLKPCIAVILNIESDHIDWHETEENYICDKLKIISNIDSSSQVILNSKLLDIFSRYGKNVLIDNVVTFSSEMENASFSFSGRNIFYENQSICDTSLFYNIMPGNHNIENIMAAIAVCEKLGLNILKCAEFINGFSLGKHRLELVAEYNGIKFINDSKSTNPASLIAAVEYLGGDKNVCLIAGGLDKDMDFSKVLDLKNKIKKVFLIGKSRIKLEKLFRTVLNYNRCPNFEYAVRAACDYAETGDIVLLSPGCASMDMFENYEERGNYFKYLINRRLLHEEKNK